MGGGSDSETILKEQMSKSVQVVFEITRYFISKSLTNVAKQSKGIFQFQTLQWEQRYKD